jgi:hypothetical protein
MFLLALLIPCIYAYSVVEDCGIASLFRIRNLTLENKTLYTSYEVFERIDNGTAEFTCALNGFHVFHAEHSLCTHISCPIGVGVHSNSTLLEIPSITGTLSCTVKFLDTFERPLLCIRMYIIQSLFSKWI